MTGFAAVPNWLVNDPTVSAHEKLTYLVLSSKIGDMGSWFTGHSEIAEAAGISVSSVQRALRSLQARGVVTWTERFDPNTKARLGNSYRLMIDRLGQGDVPPRSERPTPPVSVTEQRKNPEKEPIHIPREDAREYEARAFEGAWKAWPRTEGKQAAIKAFKSAVTKRAKDLGNRRLAVDALVTEVSRFGLAYRVTTEKTYVPHLSSWLNGARWTDPLPQARGTSVPSHIAAAAAPPAPEIPMTARQPMCPDHPGYPTPCDRCRRDEAEGYARHG